MGRTARALRIAAGVAALGATAILSAAAWIAWPLPRAILAPAAASSVTLEDRNGVVLRTTRAGDGSRARWMPLAEIAPDLLRAFVAVEDRWTLRATEALAHPLGDDPILQVGPSGAAGLAALMAIVECPDLTWVLRALHLNATTRVFMIATEGIKAG